MIIFCNTSKTISVYFNESYIWIFFCYFFYYNIKHFTRPTPICIEINYD